MDTLTRLTTILRNTLGLTNREARFDPGMRLLGDLPELDSVAVVSVLTAIEDEFGIVIDDDEMTADVFETLGSLEGFVNSKISATRGAPM